jgi:hypothetical protein
MDIIISFIIWPLNTTNNSLRIVKSKMGSIFSSDNDKCETAPLLPKDETSDTIIDVFQESKNTPPIVYSAPMTEEG